MLNNLLRTAWQNLRSHKAYLAINTVGLALGIAACLLAFLLIRYETSFDNFHENKERIYRVVAATKTPAGMNYSIASAFPVVAGDPKTALSGSNMAVLTQATLNTFLTLPINVTRQDFDRDLEQFVKKHTPAEYANHGYILQPLADMHYDGRFGTYSGSTFSKQLITALGLIGFFILIISCINFINLATAQAATVMKAAVANPVESLRTE